MQDLKDYASKYSLLAIPVVLVGLIITMARKGIPKMMAK